MSDVEQAKAHFFAALDMMDAKDFASAETRLRAALAIVPDRASAVTNLAAALFNQEKIAEACEVARNSVALDPDEFEGWLVLGFALNKLRRRNEALAAMERAVKAEENVHTLMGRAQVNAEAKRYDLAGADYEAAWKLDPNEEFLLGLLVGNQMQACDWTDFDARLAQLLVGVRAGRYLVNHATFLSMPRATAADQLASARKIAIRDFPSMPALYRGEPYRHERLRVAYVSGNFRVHPTTQLIVGVIESHDRFQFEIRGVSTGPDDKSPTRARLAGAFDDFVNMHGQSDRTIAAYLRANEVDIAIDLGGFSTGGRPRVYALRPAPVQISYLAFPGTTGLDAMDYIIADPIVIPREAHAFYSEKVITLPDCYQANDAKLTPTDATPTRTEAGLPERGFVFCSFNNNYKITPDVFSVWMDLLRAVDGSVLWLAQSNSQSSDNLRREAAARGIADERLVFAARLPIEEHLARHRLADLFIDSAPYNAHTTASDALRMGLPVVTCIGSTFPSRVAASILHAIQMPELVTESFDEYRQLALALAGDAGRLAAVKAKVVANRGTAALFDTVRLTRHLESAYATVVERQRRGEAPAAFAVAPIR